MATRREQLSQLRITTCEPREALLQVNVFFAAVEFVGEHQLTFFLAGGVFCRTIDFPSTTPSPAEKDVLLAKSFQHCELSGGCGVSKNPLNGYHVAGKAVGYANPMCSSMRYCNILIQ